MADIDFSYAGLRAELVYDEQTGLFRKIKFNAGGIYKDKPTGSLQKNGYVYVSLFGRSFRAHRLAWLYVYGDCPDHDIDHRDGNKSNNAIANLREATHKENHQNIRKAYKGSASGLLGAYPAPFNKWLSRISVNGKAVYLGHHDTPEAAHEAYLAAKRKHHEFCTI